MRVTRKQGGNGCGILLVALVMAAPLAAQTPVGPYPAWADPSLPNIYGGDKTHPALTALDPLWAASIASLMPKTLTTGVSHWYQWHPRHGELAIESSGQGIGSVATGLQYVLHLTLADLPNGQGGEIPGLMVTGIRPDGRSSIRFAPFDPSTDPDSAIVFADLLPPAPPGEIYVCAGIVEGWLYVFEAASKEIRRFVDTNNDGKPDAPDPAALPVSVEGMHEVLPMPVHGFMRGPFGPEADFAWFQDRYAHVLKVENGHLKIVTTPRSAPRPVVYRRLGAKQTKIRVFYHEERSLQAFRKIPTGWEPVSSIERTPATHDYVDLTVSKYFSEGDILIVRDANDASIDTGELRVGPRKILFFKRPYTLASEGETLFLPGDGFQAQTSSIQVKFTEDPTHQVTGLSATLAPGGLSLKIPPLPPGLGHAHLIVTIIDSRFSANAVTEVNVVKADP